MNEMEINGKTYVLKEDVDAEILKLKTELDKKAEGKESNIEGLESTQVYLRDEASTMGMGAVEVGTDFKLVNISIDLLKKSLKSIENITYGKKKRDKVTLGISNNMPLLVGEASTKKGSRWFSGIIIAPRVEDDEK